MVKREIYCETCERVVVLRKRNFQHIYHEVLCLLTVITLGIGYFILRIMKKTNTCPNCETEFDINNLPKIPEDLLKVNKIVTPQIP